MGWLEGALAAISTAMFYDKNDRQVKICFCFLSFYLLLFIIYFF